MIYTGMEDNLLFFDEDDMLVSVQDLFETKSSSRQEEVQGPSSHPHNKHRDHSFSEYLPTSYDVICGAGREAKDHPGNKRFRQILTGNVKRYSETKSKLDKSLLISEIVMSIQKRGNFIRRDEGDELGYTICSDHIAREKVGQGLRDLLHKSYRSSCTKKNRHRTRICSEIDNFIIGKVLRSSHIIAKYMMQLEQDLKGVTERPGRHGSKDSEDGVFLKLFTRTNSQVLEELKKDKSLLERVTKIQASNQS